MVSDSPPPPLTICLCLITMIQAPLLPIIIYGGYDLWPKEQFFTETGTVVVAFLPAILYEEYQNLNHNELLKLVRTI